MALNVRSKASGTDRDKWLHTYIKCTDSPQHFDVVFATLQIDAACAGSIPFM